MSEGSVRKAVGEALSALMAEADVTQTALADDLKVRRASVSDWCRHKAIPSLAMIGRIEEFCGVPRGTVLRRAGLVEDPSLEDLVAGDAGLDDEAKEAVMNAYRDALQGTAARRAGRSAEFKPLPGFDPMAPFRESLNEMMRVPGLEAAIEQATKPLRDTFAQLGENMARQVTASFADSFRPVITSGFDEAFRRAILPNIDMSAVIEAGRHSAARTTAVDADDREGEGEADDEQS